MSYAYSQKKKLARRAKREGEGGSKKVKSKKESKVEKG